MTCKNKIKVKLNNRISVNIKISSRPKIKVNFVNFGNRSDACPLITCIDGGSANTTSYPSVNGVLNGGNS